MRKKILILLPLCLLAAAAVWASAAGDAGDPLASLSYLNGAFTSKVDAAVESRLSAAGTPVQGGGGTVSAAPAAWTEARLKRDDLLQAVTGDGMLLLAGSGQVVYSSGAVVDVTDGTVIPSGGSLALRHRYLVAEDTAASFVITSKTAVVDWQGSCTFYDSTSTDYNAMAAALKAMHLFQGSYTGYGQGFDMEAAPTRLQALIMFIRVLGEEDEAMAYTGTHPFTDVPSWLDRYAAWAYGRGYANGVAPTLFGSGRPWSAGVAEVGSPDSTSHAISDTRCGSIFPAAHSTMLPGR